MDNKQEFANKMTAGLLILMLISGPIGLLIPSAIADGSGDYPPPADGDWVITSETIVTNETIVLNGNLTIEFDANLILINTTIIFNCAFDGQYGVRVKNGGELQALGDKDFTKGAQLPGDLDLFSGSDGGTIRFYRNDGTKTEPDWQDPVNLKDVNDDDVNAGSRSAPFFADLDNDGDLDLIIGERRDDGQVNYYENTGTVNEPEWTRDDSMFPGVESGGHSKPTLADLDNDEDLDLVVGEEDGDVHYFKNIGTPENAEWDSRVQLKDAGGSDIDVGSRAWPTFADIDNDGDIDLAVGESDNGDMHFFRNTGTPETFEFTQENSVLSGTSIGTWNAAPAFADLDFDGDLDLTIGSYQSGFFYYENTGTKEVPEWTEDDTMYAGVDESSRMQPAFADIDGDGPGFIPGEAIWNTEFNTTGEFSFTFLVESGASFEMEKTRVLNCGSTIPSAPSLTIETDDVSIVDCMFEFNNRGISLEGASNTEIRDTTFLNNSVGIFVYQGTGNSIVNCSFITNDQGIKLDSTGDVTIRDSTFSSCGVTIDGNTEVHYDSHTFVNNSVNGGPLYYVVNADGQTIPTDAGSVIIVSSANMIIKDLNLTEGDVGILLAYADTSLIQNVTINGCDHGLNLWASDDNTIMYSTITNGDVGILVSGLSTGVIANFNSIHGNSITGADAAGNGGNQIDAVRNVWGDPSGPHHPASNPDGTGDEITDDVLFEPWLLAPHGTNNWYVDGSAPGGGNGAIATPFNLIQDALDMASLGENVFVLPGTYSENLIFNRPAQVYGVQGEVVLDAIGGTGVTINEGALDSIIANITFTNGATDLLLEADAFLFNSSFDSGKVSFTGDPLLTVGYYLDVQIVNVDDDPVEGASFDLTDSQSDTLTYFTDLDGRIDDLTVVEYRRNPSGTVQSNPYLLSAFDYATGYYLSPLDIHSDLSIELNLTRHGSFGTSIATGDLNGDGFEDIAVGAPTDSQNGENSGAVFIFFGPQGAIKSLRPIDADLVIHGVGEGDRFGSLLAVDDVNDDEVDELIVGTPDFARTTTGINGMYYQDSDYTGLEFTRIDSIIDFPWGNGGPDGLGDQFSVKWYGSLYVEEEDDYTFFAEIDDEMYFYIDDTMVIERTSYSGEEASSDPIHLDPGFHDIAINYRETGGGAKAIVKWQSSTIAKQVIPTEHLYSNFDTGTPDGGVFVFDGDLFDQGPLAEVAFGDALLLASDGEGLGGTLTTADIDENGYPDILAGNSFGTEVFYGQDDIDATIQQATLHGFERPVMVKLDDGQALAAVVSDEIRLFSMSPDQYALDALTSVDDFQGTFNFTTFDDGLTIFAYEIVEIMPNGDFDSGWNNWTQAENMRDKNNGEWELTNETTERGDWHVYDGSTAGLGPDQDELNGGGGGWNGENCDGLLSSDPFQVPSDVIYVDFWHHAKWYTFEVYGDQYQQEPYDDMILLRLKRASNDETVEEIVYRKPPTSGEEEGRLKFDVTDYAGEDLIFEMETVTDYRQYDDAIIQIDDIIGLKTVPDANGDFISDVKDLDFSLRTFNATWDKELNNGSIELFFRTNTSDEWTPLEEDTFIELTENEDTTFQYRVNFEAGPGESYPVLTKLFFNFYAYVPESYGPGAPYNAGAIFGNASLAKIDGSSAVVYNDTNPAITISSDFPIDALASYMDIDRNGVSDLIVSSNDIVYLFPMERVEDDLELTDTPYFFSGEEGFGSELLGNNVGSPTEHRGDGRVYLLPTGLNDTAIHGVDIENNSRIYPDTMITLNVILQNKGLFDMDSVEVTLDITDGGAYSYQDSTVISIASWDTKIVGFDWDIPADEGTGYHISFSLSPDDENSNNDFSIDLYAHYHALDLLTDKDFDVMIPEGTLHYLIDINHLGTFKSDDVTFQTDLPLGWDWWLQKDGENFTHFIVYDSDQIELFVRPDTTVLGEYPFELSVMSENGFTTATLDLKAHIVLADLIPLNVRMYREDGKEAKLVAKDNVTLVLEIGNAGTQDTGSYEVSMDVDGDHDLQLTGEGIEGTESLLINFTYAFTEGSHNLTFVVDVDDEVKEYDETNNIFILRIEVFPEMASSPFEFKVNVIDQFGENVTGANVLAKSGESQVENVTDDSGNINLTLLDPYIEGNIYLVEAFSDELYASKLIHVYSEDIFVEITLVVGRYSIILSSDVRDKDIMPNGEQSFFFNITNTGDFNDSYVLSLAGLPEEWIAEYSGIGIVDDLLTLEKDGSTMFELNLTAWRYAPAHERYEIVLTVSSQLSPYTAKDVILRATVLPVENITFYTENTYEHGLPKDPITHRLYVNNTGNTERTINLIVTGDTDSSWLNKEEFTLAPGEIEDVLFIITIPNLRDGTILNHELAGIVSGIGTTTTISFTTLIDRRSSNIFEAMVQEDELIITNIGNHLEYVTVTTQTEYADVVLQPDTFFIDMETSISIQMELHMNDMSISYGSLIPVFVSIYNGERYFINQSRNVAVPAVENLSLSIVNTTLKVIPGSIAELSILVVNTGNLPEMIFFNGTNSGPEPINLPPPISLQQNEEEYVIFRVQFPSYAIETRSIIVTGRAGEIEQSLEILVDLSVNRSLALEEISARSNKVGTRYTINLHNYGEARERLNLQTTCGELDLLLTQIEASEYTQFHLLVPHGQYCSDSIKVQASSPIGEGISISIDLLPPPHVEIQIVGTLPAKTTEPVIIRATGDYSSYSWLIDTKNRLEKEIYYNFTTPGTYPVALTVIDSRNIYSIFTVEINVENQAPTVNIETNVFGVVGENIRFDASDSRDPDGVISNISWEIQDQTLEGLQLFHVFRSEGVYDVILTVTDEMGLSNSTTIKVTIRESDDDGKVEDEKEELNNTIIALSLLILICIIAFLLYSFKELEIEEEFLLEKLNDQEREGFSGEDADTIEVSEYFGEV